MQQLKSLTAHKPVQKIFNIFGSDIRLVGGCVRDVLAKKSVGDMDFATTLTPDQVMEKLEAKKIKCIPTGLDHGTVTAVIDGKGYEITTLRKDISTDGRHAVVAFTDDWMADAARRDFTINALYVDKAGNLYDYFGGVKDLKEKRVRFIGDADQRIREDYLRILRFFRFSARFGKAPFDKNGLGACVRHKQDLRQLSGERVAQELIKWLGTDDPFPTLKAAKEKGILFEALGTGPFYPARVKKIIPYRIKKFEKVFSWVALAALLDEKNYGKATMSLRLSNQVRDFMKTWCQEKIKTTIPGVRQSLYYQGVEKTYGLLLLKAARTPVRGVPSLLKIIAAWQEPVFPVSGSDLLRQGFKPGPALGKKLQALEKKWVQSGFKLNRKALLKV